MTTGHIKYNNGTIDLYLLKPLGACLNLIHKALHIVVNTSLKKSKVSLNPRKVSESEIFTDMKIMHLIEIAMY